ncbi:helix-turn-helix transcriptional regulator [Acidovorax facilis]|uniref:helix-turn-helix transcriptional regulator n=1 Tax=Acidovorax facilis TaxID=12917 RepID=UPI003D6618E0
MPSAPTRSTLARQWQLLSLLPARGPGQSASALCDELALRGYHVSKRQVERDLRELASLFPLHRNDASIPYGWRWADGAERCVPGMDTAEALSLAMAHQMVAPLLPASMLDLLRPRFVMAERMLAEVGQSNQLASWRNKIHSAPMQLGLMAPLIDAEVVRTVHEALLGEEQIDIGYRQAAGAPRALRLHPLGLVQRGPVGYLLATAWEYEDPRLYALHRMVSARRTHEPARIPPGFDLQTSLVKSGAQFGDDLAPMEVQLRCDASLINILQETPLAVGQTILDGVVTATLPNSWELQWWILSQGPAVEVLAPPALRRAIAECLNAASGLYAAE